MRQPIGGKPPALDRTYPDKAVRIWHQIAVQPTAVDSDTVFAEKINRIPTSVPKIALKCIGVRRREVRAGSREHNGRSKGHRIQDKKTLPGDSEQSSHDNIVEAL